MSRTKKPLHPGLAIAKSDGGWLASYRNSVGKIHEIGIFSNEEKAEKAGSLWLQGFRFDAMRAEYEAFTNLHDIAAKWGCHASVVRECIVISGGTLRDFRTSAANRKRPVCVVSRKMTGDKLIAAQQRMVEARKLKPPTMSDRGKANVRANLEKANAVVRATRAQYKSFLASQQTVEQLATDAYLQHQLDGRHP